MLKFATCSLWFESERFCLAYSVERHSCYMFRADELHAEVSSDTGGKGASQGMFIGCFIDTATGFITLQCDGKDTRHKYRMEPGTKLFPGVFLEPTSKETLQIELGRTPTTLPLSAAVLQNSDKHVIPQMPPRLKVQILKVCPSSSCFGATCRGGSFVAQVLGRTQ